MLSGGIIKAISVGTIILGMGVQLITNWLDEKKMEEKIDEKVNEALSKRDKEES